MHAKIDYILRFKNELNWKIHYIHIVQKLICSIQNYAIRIFKNVMVNFSPKTFNGVNS